MSKVKDIGPDESCRPGGRLIVFDCPGCRYAHAFEVPRWTWNGSLDKPTFSPSLIVGPDSAARCHSFVREGRIEFLSDCHHALAGQTVDLPEVKW